MKVMISFYMVMMVVMVAYAHPVEKYPEPKDVDVEEFLNLPRLYSPMYLCVINKGKCTPDGKQLRDGMKDALQTNCEKCTEKHISEGKKVIKFMIENKPEDWKTIKSIYDPDGKYSAKYEKELKELQG